MTYEPDSRPAPEPVKPVKPVAPKTGLNNGEMTRAAEKFIDENGLDVTKIPADGGRIGKPEATAYMASIE